jgi:hypothetical protein
VRHILVAHHQAETDGRHGLFMLLCQLYEGAYDDARGLYSRAMRSYIKWLVDAPGHFNNWLHSVMFTVTSAALPLTARGSIDLGDLSTASSLLHPDTREGGRPNPTGGTPQAGDLLR